MTKNKKHKKNIYLSRGALKSAIARLMKSKPKAQFHAKQLIRKLKIKNSSPQVVEMLKQLADQGVVRQLEGGRYIFAQGKVRYKQASVAQGYVDMIRSGAAFILVDGMEQDVYVPRAGINGALHGDLVEIEYKGRKGGRPDGKVTGILDRAVESFQAVIREEKTGYTAVVDHKGKIFDITVSNFKMWPTLRTGDPVIIRITKWSDDRNEDHLGVVTTLLGDMPMDDIQMTGILLSEGFNLEHSPAAQKEAEALPSQVVITEEDLAERKDFRGVTTFTIDPVDAKDFDDALSIEKHEDGTYTLGVHIADVTHYVPYGSALDEEAYDRSTSVYLVDRVLPMLPEKLSNGLCSLRPHEDRYSYSAWFTLDEDYKVLARSFGKSVIHSDHRFSYGSAQAVLDAGQGEYHDELSLLREISRKYRKARFKNGALNFETDELRFKLDDDGNPISVYTKERKDTHLLVEEFMLLANREVATYINKVSAPAPPFVYRIHDLPDEDKLQDVRLFALEMGLELKFDHPKQIAKSFDKLRKAAKLDPRFKILEPMGIRAMSKAEYSPENIGHYGLAFDYYTHFTSPIRRYSDVLVHRILESVLQGKGQKYKKPQLEKQTKHISRQERKAQKAERDSNKYFQVKYMKQYEGQVLQGMVNGMIEIGFFVEMTDSKAEGMVMWDSLDESYELESSRLRAKASRSGAVIKVGDVVTVKVREANLESRKIELDWVGPAPSEPEQEGDA